MRGSRRRPIGVWGKPPAADGWVLGVKPSATGGNGVFSKSKAFLGIFRLKFLL